MGCQMGFQTGCRKGLMTNYVKVGKVEVMQGLNVVKEEDGEGRSA